MSGLVWGVIWALMWGLAALVVLPVLLALVALMIPVHITARLTEDGTSAELRFLSARLPPVWRGRPGRGAREAPEVRTGPDGVKERAVPETSAAPAAPARRRSRSRRPSRFVRRLIPLALRALPGLIADTIRGVHLDRLSATGRFGLGDPAETGALYGRLCPLLFAPLPDPVRVDIAPDFDLAGFDGTAEIAFHAVPLRLAWPSLRTGLTLVWRAAW